MEELKFNKELYTYLEKMFIRNPQDLYLTDEEYRKYLLTNDGIFYSWLPTPESPKICYTKGKEYKVYNIG